MIHHHHLADILNEWFPMLKGFSSRNLRRMRDYYNTYKDCPATMDRTLELSWTQNVVILESCATSEQRLFYIDLAAKENLSKLALMKKIEAGKFEESLLPACSVECCASSETAINPVEPTMPIVVGNTEGAGESLLLLDAVEKIESPDKSSALSVAVENAESADEALPLKVMDDNTESAGESLPFPADFSAVRSTAHKNVEPECHAAETPKKDAETETAPQQEKTLDVIRMSTKKSTYKAAWCKVDLLNTEPQSPVPRTMQRHSIRFRQGTDPPKTQDRHSKVNQCRSEILLQRSQSYSLSSVLKMAASRKNPFGTPLPLKSLSAAT